MTFKPERLALVADPLQSELGPDRYRAGVERGSEMSGDEAVAFVLSGLDRLVAQIADITTTETCYRPRPEPAIRALEK